MNAPTLLVGLGGTGCKIINRVSKLVTEEQRKNIAFAMFDTDINELNDIKKKNPFVKIIQTSTKQTVGEYLNKDVYACDKWFPVNAILNSKTLTEGAGQVRSISRLALDTVIHAGKMEPLHEAIHSLYKVEEDKPEQALRVVIVSSLAGGTGSGLILPVAMYIKNYLATRFRQSANITRGFFILPEVFFEVIPGQTERNNLKANAYATLRELDAFLMKGDATLHDKYKNTVVMKFPRAASEGYEEYDVRPYDFCFLFDAQNAEGGKLNSFEQYLDHAANCIYAQSIGPMNKRSNSSEDNTIRKLAKENGRNRYAGAGASVLVYPFEDVRTYIALQWAKECISKQWLVYDTEYKALCKENKIKEEQGVAIPNPNPNEHYVKAVESSAKKNDPFSKAIVRTCATYDVDGVSKINDRWLEYDNALKMKVFGDEKVGNTELDSKLAEINSMFGDLDADWIGYLDLFTEIERYRMMVSKYVEETARVSAYNLFKASREFRTTKPEPYELEYYLSGTDDSFIHPNAVRYFLNKTYEIFQKELQTADSELTQLRNGFATFESETFDNPDTEDVIESATSLVDRKVSLRARLSNTPTADQEEIRNKMRVHLTNIGKYREKYMMTEVFREGCDYISRLLKGFELFYSTFETKVSTLDKRISDIKNKYGNRNGSTMRYVCASAKCLDEIYRKKQFVGSAITIDSELAKKIYYNVLNYALMDKQPSTNRYFSKIFDKDILGYYENYVMQKYGDTIDVDIIRALEMEAVYVHPEYESAENANTLIEQYVIKIINNTRNLSCPFIESPLGEAREPIHACTYSIELEENIYKDDPKRLSLIKRELRNNGGSPDEDIDIHMIMFYQSFYGLRANDLSKFAPPEKTMTYQRSSGEYFKAYYELIGGIHPESHRSREISPHIDRWWHIVTKMPDLDEENQRRQEYKINAAFFWSILAKYVELIEEGNGHSRYILDKEELEMTDNRLVVSNGTPCDKLYEVLDAIAIYPELVHKIMSRVEVMTADDINKNRELKDGILIRNMNKLSMVEPGVGRGVNIQPAKSIFAIPLLMKKSSTPDIYYEDCVIEIIKVEIAEIKKYLTGFYSQKELPRMVRDIIMEQFEKYLKDIAVEANGSTSIYRETLFSQTVAIIAKALENLGFEDDKREIKDRVDELKNPK